MEDARKHIAVRRRELQNENRAEIVDIGQRRSGDEAIAERFEKPVAVIILKRLLRANAPSQGALQRVRRDIGAGDFLEAIDTIGVAGERVNSGMALQGQRER